MNIIRLQWPLELVNQRIYQFYTVFLTWNRFIIYYSMHRIQIRTYTYINQTNFDRQNKPHPLFKILNRVYIGNSRKAPSAFSQITIILQFSSIYTLIYSFDRNDGANDDRLEFRLEYLRLTDSVYRKHNHLYFVNALMSIVFNNQEKLHNTCNLLINNSYFFEKFNSTHRSLLRSDHLISLVQQKCIYALLSDRLWTTHIYSIIGRLYAPYMVR